jgi:hypothetical protein
MSLFDRPQGGRCATARVAVAGVQVQLVTKAQFCWADKPDGKLICLIEKQTEKDGL